MRIPNAFFRFLCLFTAAANIFGNVGLLLFYRPLYSWLGIPLPVNLHSFAIDALFSILIGIVALMIFLDPTQRSIGLLKIGILGKGSYVLITYFFFAVYGLHWFFLIFVVWDTLFVVIFFLYWLRLESPDLLRLQEGVQPGLQREPSHRALIIGHTLTGVGPKAVDELRDGLRAGGYETDTLWIEAREPLFHFPFSLVEFIRMAARAMFRRPAPIEPLSIPGDDYDLIVVQSPTWIYGVAAPVEALFQDPRYRQLFAGRDAVALVVCRGARRRTEAMLVRRLQDSGAHVVAARGHGHSGWEPRRLFSLGFYLVFGRAGVPPLLANKEYGLSPTSLEELRQLGRALAERPRTERTIPRIPEADHA